MIFATHATGKVFYASPEWNELTGQTTAGVRDLRRIAGVHPEDRDAVEAILDAAVRAQAAFSIRFRLRRTDGRYVWVVAGAAPSFGARREFIGFLGSVAHIAVSHSEELQAYGSLDGHVAPSLPEVPAASRLDSLADHLLVVRALLADDGDTALRQWIELGLYMVRRKLPQVPAKRARQDAR